MKMHFVMAAIAAVLLSCSPALAQVGGVGTSPLGAASPLAMGSGVPVAPTGISLGATEMTMPGTSPPPSANLGCSSAGGPASQTATPLFDGAGMAGVASSGCAAAGGAGSSTPTQSTPRVGGVAIPLGSTELSNAGLSPPPPLSTMFVSPIVPPTASPLSTMGAPPSAATAPPCPVTGTFPDTTAARASKSGAIVTLSPGC